MAKRINQARCIQCGDCIPACPSGGIDNVEGSFIIKSQLCTECYGVAYPPTCEQACPVGAVLSDIDHQDTAAVMAARAAELRPDLFPRD